MRKRGSGGAHGARTGVLILPEEDTSSVRGTSRPHCPTSGTDTVIQICLDVRDSCICIPRPSKRNRACHAWNRSTCSRWSYLALIENNASNRSVGCSFVSRDGNPWRVWRDGRGQKVEGALPPNKVDRSFDVRVVHKHA
jgi:hypothetical protein